MKRPSTRAASKRGGAAPAAAPEPATRSAPAPASKGRRQAVPEGGLGIGGSAAPAVEAPASSPAATEAPAPAPVEEAAPARSGPRRSTIKKAPASPSAPSRDMPSAGAGQVVPLPARRRPDRGRRRQQGHRTRCGSGWRERGRARQQRGGGAGHGGEDSQGGQGGQQGQQEGSPGGVGPAWRCPVARRPVRDPPRMVADDGRPQFESRTLVFFFTRKNVRIGAGQRR